SGQGIAMLEAAGVEVEVVELASAKACIQGFVSRITRGRPFVRLKTATSLDGAVALSNGDSQWITGDAARLDVQYWRAHSDAIVTGIGSVLADDCQLTVRDSAFKHAHAPLRVVLDSRGRTPLDAKVLDEQAPTLLVHKVGHVDLSLPKAGHVQQLALAHGPNDLSSVLRDLAERGCNDVLVEAGPKVIGSFLRAGLWDEWIAYIAPKLLGADSHLVTDLALARLPDAPQARLVETTQIGDDLRLTLRPRDL
ncbi:MAG: bifunctional diaminohydroxyphosphoribosylaminopyrimidine deaminase/5-amino-6-(5-phosphoribosylamino)uracil reductase RibD, partial [Pseudomonadota bacterium]|nr:bifunctional diaminohydroxyphosphoribosylaminopyrimidine deaminase/5-amino-6-(5-phosphoribosylamino)uracil reductase RibD [Pseudomonadota bacterium]